MALLGRIILLRRSGGPLIALQSLSHADTLWPCPRQVASKSQRPIFSHRLGPKDMPA